MLGGLDPILIFQFSKLTPSAQKAVDSIPVISSIVNTIGLPPVPIYLSRELSGMVDVSQSKAVDIETNIEPLYNGLQPNTTQRPINSVTTIELEAERGSLGLILLSSLIDLVLPKVTSKEYSLTYINKEVTIIGGLLHSFSIDTGRDNTLARIKLEITKVSGDKKPAAVQVDRVTEGASLDTGGVISPTEPLNPPLSGPAPVAPSTPPPVNIGGPA